MSSNNYMDMIFDPIISHTYDQYKHKYDDFWERVEEEKRKAVLNCAREFGEDAPWKEISQRLKETDINFIREFKQFIYWDEVDREVKYNSSFYEEFKKEIETALQEKLEIDTSLLDALVTDLV